MNYIVILNYNTGEVFYRELTEADDKLSESDIEAFFKKYQLNSDECSWMFTHIKPELNYLNSD